MNSSCILQVSSPQMRGKLSSLPALLLALGVLLGYVLGNNVENRA